MRILKYCSLLCLMISSSLWADDFALHYRDAITAYQAQDQVAFLEAATAARAVRPDSPQAIYLHAAAQALNEQTEAAMENLNRLAEGGLQFSPDREPAFASLYERDDFKALLEAFAANAKPQGQAQVSFRLEQRDFVPEGLAYDPQTQRFLLGSVHTRKIMQIDQAGDATVFIPADQDGLMSVFGIHVDADNRKLYVATSGLKESGEIKPEQLGRGGVLVFDLDNGSLQQSWWLPKDDREHVFGDLAVRDDGLVFITDSVTGELLCVDMSTGEYKVLIEPDVFTSPQGLVFSEDQSVLYIAGYRGGLFHYDLASQELTLLNETGSSQQGVDGLYRYGSWLLAVQNGLRPHRVMALRLDETGKQVAESRVLVAGLPEFDDPTLGVIVGSRFHFVANSHWPSFNQEGQLQDVENLEGPIIMSVALPE